MMWKMMVKDVMRTKARRKTVWLVVVVVVWMGLGKVVVAVASKSNNGISV